MLGLRFFARAFSSCGKRGPLFIAVRGPLLLQSTGSRHTGSVVVAHGPSCSAACGILPDQGSNPCPLHWQADSQSLRHQGSPKYFLMTLTFIFLLNEIKRCWKFPGGPVVGTPCSHCLVQSLVRGLRCGVWNKNKNKAKHRNFEK